MKIIILSNLFPPHSKGGAEEAAKNQAAKLVLAGHEVCVITLSPENKCEVKQSANKKIYYIPHKNIFNYFDIGKKPVWLRFLWHIIDTFNFWLADDIEKIVEDEKPDLVIGHNLKGLSCFTPKVINKLDIGYWQIIHDVSLYTPSGLIEWGKENSWEHIGFLTRSYRFFMRRLFSYPKKVFFPSVWLLNFYRKNNFFINQEKIYKPNEINFSCSSPAQERKDFLYVGQLEYHKGIMLLLDLFEKLPEQILNIIGDGSLMPEVRKRAENNPNIKIHGKMPREDLSKFYGSAKAVLVPSLVYENAPNVVAEALSCKAPVIVSRIGGAYESIKEGENGYTFEPGNVNELADKVKLFF